MKQKNSLIIKYLPADYKDCFWEKITNKPNVSVQELFDLMFIQYPKWVSWLLKLRDFIVKPGWYLQPVITQYFVSYKSEIWA